MAITITISPYNTTQILNDISLCVFIFITYNLFQTQIELEDFLWHGNWPWLLKNYTKKLSTFMDGLILYVSEGFLTELLCIHNVGIGSFDLYGLILYGSEGVLS